MIVQSMLVDIWLYNIEQQDYYTYDIMKRTDWNGKVVDVPNTYFDEVINKYRRLFGWQEIEQGNFYYSCYSNTNNLYFIEDFLRLFKKNKYYCLQSSLQNISSLLDSTPYKNSIEYNKAIASINKFIGHLEIEYRFISLSWKE